MQLEGHGLKGLPQGMTVDFDEFKDALDAQEQRFQEVMGLLNEEAK